MLMLIYAAYMRRDGAAPRSRERTLCAIDARVLLVYERYYECAAACSSTPVIGSAVIVAFILS